MGFLGLAFFDEGARRPGGGIRPEKAHDIQQAGIKTALAPEFGNAAEQPALALIPVLAVITDGLELVYSAEDLFQQADCIVVGEVTRTVLAGARILGENGDAQQCIGILTVPVIG